MPSKKAPKKGITHENVRISVGVMQKVREYCDSNKVLLGGFFELAAKEKLERETVKSTNHE